MSEQAPRDRTPTDRASTGRARRFVRPGPDLLRSTALGVVALVCLVLGREITNHHRELDHWRVVAYVVALVLLLAGVGATRSAARELSRVIDVRADQGIGAGRRASAPVRVAILVVGYLFTLLMVLAVLQVDLSQFLLGGAVTGVIIGIAAQQTLGNFFAGTVLLISRPYVAGDQVTIFNAAVNGPHQGTITDVGLIYTTLATSAGDLLLPNSVLLSSVIGPATPVDPDRQWTGPPPHA